MEKRTPKVKNPIPYKGKKHQYDKICPDHSLHKKGKKMKRMKKGGNSSHSY